MFAARAAAIIDNTPNGATLFLRRGDLESGIRIEHAAKQSLDISTATVLPIKGCPRSIADSHFEFQ
jgi:hypothetical protein